MKKEEENVEKDSSIKLDILKEYEFNLGSNLGTMLHNKKKFDFNSLDGIQYSYQQTFLFCDNSGRRVTLPEAKAWFSGDDYKELVILEAIRHVLVHKGGQADKAFLDRVKNRDLAFSALQLNDRVLLDGLMAQKYIGAAVKRGVILIGGINEWLKKPE